jgi:outer membrane protein
VQNGACKQGRSLGRMLWYGLFAVCLLMGADQSAAQPDTQRWTLAQCLERALEASPEVHEARADIQIAESQLARAKAGRLPKASFTGFLTAITGAEGNAVTGDTTNDLGPFTKGEVEIVQPLYTFGRLRNEIRAARQGVMAKQAATAKARQAVAAAVKELYYNILLSRQIKELLTESQENFLTALEKAQERLEAQEGTVTQEDVLRLRIGLSGVSKEIFTLERAAAVALSALKRQLGLPADTDFDIADTRLEPVELQLQSLPTYLEQAGQSRPEIAQIAAGLEAQRARLEAARSGYYPSFFLAGGLKYTLAPNRHNEDESPFAVDYNSVNPGGALGIRWDLDFWMTRAKVEEHRAEVAKVEIQKQNAETGIDLDVRRRYLEVQENLQKLEPAQDARKAARALMLTNIANFTLGIGEAKDIFSSIGLYTRMASEYYEAVRDLNIAAARLSQATGQEVATLTSQP